MRRWHGSGGRSTAVVGGMEGEGLLEVEEEVAWKIKEYHHPCIIITISIHALFMAHSRTKKGRAFHCTIIIPLYFVEVTIRSHTSFSSAFAFACVPYRCIIVINDVVN
jgi:hypothetical protein